MVLLGLAKSAKLVKAAGLTGTILGGSELLDWLHKQQLGLNAVAHKAPAGIDWHELSALAQLANMTSKSPETLFSWSVINTYCKGSEIVTRDLDGLKQRYFVHRGEKGGEKVQTLAIRGTVNKTNWASNLDLKKIWDIETKCYLHAGFKRVADAVLEDVEEGKLLQRDEPILLVGHSLGGSVAAALAIKLQNRGYTVRKCVTFGAARITDDQGAKLHSSVPLLRVTHEHDAVPVLPRGSYQHFGEHLVLLQRGLYHEPQSTPSSKFEALGTRLHPVHKWKHRMHHYEEEIAQRAREL
ncbi:unnamed protein product [Chrysoparadoxa australica]